MRMSCLNLLSHYNVNFPDYFVKLIVVFKKKKKAMILDEEYTLNY